MQPFTSSSGHSPGEPPKRGSRFWALVYNVLDLGPVVTLIGLIVGALLVPPGYIWLHWADHADPSGAFVVCSGIATIEALCLGVFLCAAAQVYLPNLLTYFLAKYDALMTYAERRAKGDK